MDGTGGGRPAASRRAAAGTVAAYAAAIVAFAYALVSLYWAAGGQALISTVGGYVQQFAGRGGAVPLLAALAAAVAKVAGGLLALARPWGRAVRRRRLLIVSAGASMLLVAYGGLNVLLGALVLAGVIHPSGGVDRTAALARRGLGPVVPGVGDLARPGHRRLRPAGGQQDCRVRGWPSPSALCAPR